MTAPKKPADDLQAFLRREFPEYRTRQDILDVHALAAALEMSAEGVYKWLRSDRMSADGARKVMALTKGRPRPLTSERIYRFVLG